MKRSLAAVAALLTVAPLMAASLSACDPKTRAADAHVEAPGAVAATGVGAAAADDHGAPGGSASEAPAAEGAVRVANAPDFAAVYPGGLIDGEPTTADGPTGPGGMVSFTTEARPDAVIAFYKQKAGAAGLAPVMSLNQGDNVGFGAVEASSGATLQVVARAMEKAPTSVQLTWSAGQ